jgi:transposase InsO family protein
VLTDEGMTALFAKTFATVYPPGTTFTASQSPIFYFERPDSQSGWTLPREEVYPANMFTAEEMSTIRNLSDWHDACGHLNFHTLRRQKPWGDTLHVPANLPNPWCDSCERAKITKRKRGKFKERILEDESTDSYYFDLSGKFAQASIYGEYYYLLIKRSRTGWCWDEYLKSKAESLKLLRRFFLRRLKKLPKNIALAIMAVSDNAKEFVQKKLKKWFKKNDIIQKTTVVDHPSDRGIIEVEMKVSKRTAATMLLHQDLPDPFAFLAVHHALWCRNRWIQATREYKSPYELEYGKKPSYHLFRPFGCACVVLLPGKPKGVGPRC